ncbi:MULTISPECIES: TonB C-terminal domain-containing protein [unclassified Helicobacter]|uniref:TonB C-terminal domain-containing protein n=1 Tax=unclassified Helicobacter TaxID=2593540 RepID=UPI000CF0CE62|nr:MULTISPECIES: TonB C-terminal domain-containing protein [unclassified Helicobacter]
MKKKSFFYLTGSFSFLLYLAVVFAIFGIINLKKADKFIIKADTQFEQTLPIEALVIDEPVVKIPKAEVQPEVENENNEEELQLPGLKDLFSGIPDWSKDIEKQKEEQEKRKQEAQRRAYEEKKRYQEMLRQQQESIKNLQTSIQSTNRALENINASIDIKTEIPPNQDKGIHDEWVEKIYKILYENWDFSFYQKTIISVLITITDNGDFSYKILRYSQYDEYNQKIKAVLEKLKGVKMPPYPHKKFINVEVNFRSKAQDE